MDLPMNYNTVQIGRDKQTVVVQYHHSDSLRKIQNYIRNNRKNQSHTVINDWVCIDGFVNLGYSIKDSAVNRCVRIVYELLDGNPSPSPFNNRFQDAYIVVVNEEEERRLLNGRT